MPDRSEKLSLQQAGQMILDECRMVLPGIQALFGFQLIAVFSDRFAGDLSEAQQIVHLVAIGMVAIAVFLVMAPAAYHRQTSVHSISERFISVATNLLLLALIPLGLALCLDFYLVAYVITGNGAASAVLAVLLLAIGATLWLVLPHARRSRA